VLLHQESDQGHPEGGSREVEGRAVGEGRCEGNVPVVPPGVDTQPPSKTQTPNSELFFRFFVFLSVFFFLKATPPSDCALDRNQNSQETRNPTRERRRGKQKNGLCWFFSLIHSRTCSWWRLWGADLLLPMLLLLLLLLLLTASRSFACSASSAARVASKAWMRARSASS
jgi:hypothetical protein